MFCTTCLRLARTGALVAGLAFLSTGIASAEQASRAESFIDSIGVNLHTSFGTYAKFAEVRSLLVQLGIHHFRDAIVASKFVPNFVSLAKVGIFGDYITTIGQTRSTWKNWVLMLGSPKYVDAFEGPNELDCRDPQFAGHLQGFIPDLWTTVQQNFAGIAVIGPSTGCGPNNFVPIGNLSRFMTYGNAHNYSNGFRPENSGPSSPAEARVAYEVVGGEKPVMTTENGYGTSPTENGSNVTLLAQTIYAPRMLLYQFTSGIARTYWFELIDTPEEGAPYTSFGLVDHSYRPKPAYMAVRNLISALADTPGAPAFQPGSLAFDLSGNTSDVAHALFEKSDGEFDLCLWLTKPVYDPRSKKTFTVAPQAVTVTVQQALRDARISTLGDTGAMSTQSVATSGSAPAIVNVNVTDSVSVVRLVPAAK